MSESESLIVDAAERLFSDLESGSSGCTVDQIRWRWAQVAAVGLDRLLVPEHAGGFDFSSEEIVATLRSAGSNAVEAPILEGMLARWLVALDTRTNQTEPEGSIVMGRLLQGKADGERVVEIPYGRAFAQACCVELRTGRLHLLIFNVDPDRLDLRENLAGEPLDQLRLGNSVESKALQLLPDRFDGLCAHLRAAQMLGAMERALAIAIEYASTRQQFGRPIGQFQAVQQMLAALAGQIAAVAAAVDGATICTHDVDAWVGGGLAKARASDAVATVNAIAHQVTAAMGFTREFALHRFTRRLWAWRDEFGSEQFWHERLGALALAHGGEGLWPLLVDAIDVGGGA